MTRRTGDTSKDVECADPDAMNDKHRDETYAFAMQQLPPRLVTDLLRQLLGRASLAALLESVPACAHIELLQLALAVGEGPRGWQSLSTQDERTCGFQAPECVHGDQGGAAPGDASHDSANASTVCRALRFRSLEASDNTARGPARSHGRAV